MNTAELIVGSLCGLVLVGVFIWIGVALHLAYTKIDVLLNHLKNCSAIMSRAPLRYGGPWGHLLLIGGISGIVTFPSFYLKRGELSSEDLRNLPEALKRRLVVLQFSVIGLLIAMALFVTIGKSGVLK
jgi:hypothetical protein